MIFRPDMAAMVLAGTKTQTRRPVKGDAPCRYVAGRTYAVQDGRGRPAMGRVRVLSVRREMSHSISFDDALAEGFRSADGFRERWFEMHGRFGAMWCWRIEIQAA